MRADGDGVTCGLFFYIIFEYIYIYICYVPEGCGCVWLEMVVLKCGKRRCFVGVSRFVREID